MDLEIFAMRLDNDGTAKGAPLAETLERAARTASRAARPIGKPASTMPYLDDV